MCFSVLAAHINLISKSISCACMWLRKNDSLLRLSSAKDTLPSTLPLFLAKRDGWSELTLQAHLLQLWKRGGLTLALLTHLSVSRFFPANTTSFLLSLPRSLTCRAHALCVMHQCEARCPIHEGHLMHVLHALCSRKFSYAPSSVHIK